MTYIYKLNQGFEFHGINKYFDLTTSAYYNGDIRFKCKNKQKTRLVYSRDTDTLRITSGYAWDGCSPKITIPNFITVGTPDGTMDTSTGRFNAWRASLIHDALYQFRDAVSAEGMPLPGNRKIYDMIFRDILIEDGFRFPRFYYLVVRVFGEIFANLVEFIKR